MQHLTETARKSIAALRELITRATGDIEGRLGGPMSGEAGAALRAWLAKAFEAGRHHPLPPEKPTPAIVAYLERSELLRKAPDFEAYAKLVAELETMWDALLEQERAYILDMRKVPR